MPQIGWQSELGANMLEKQPPRTDLKATIKSLEAEKQWHRQEIERIEVALDALKKLTGEPATEQTAKSANGLLNLLQPPTQFEQVAAFLVRKNNKPMTQREIEAEMGTKRNALATVLYQTHKDFFSKGNKEGFNKRILWSLTQKAFDEARRRIN
jgi:hypothetical protein